MSHFGQQRQIRKVAECGRHGQMPLIVIKLSQEVFQHYITKLARRLRLSFRQKAPDPVVAETYLVFLPMIVFHESRFFSIHRLIMITALQSWLFPPALNFSFGFTTSPYVNLPQVTPTELSDSSLGVFKIESGTTHPVVTGPNRNEDSWEAFYPEGSYNPQGSIRGGFGFYLKGPDFFAQQLPTANEVLTSYSVMFEQDWDWVKGGKLPGQFGGVGDLAYHCSGGRQYDRTECFDLRFMWRAGGAGEVYAYLPLTKINANTLAKVPPQTVENPDYGFSVGRGAWTFRPGAWNVVAERIKLNDPGKNNGILQVWVNGTTVIHVQGLQLRNSSASIFQGMHFQTFFGGSNSAYATTKNQTAWFSDVSGAILS